MTNKNGVAKVVINKAVLNKLKVGQKVIYAAGFGQLIVKKIAVVKR